MEQIAVTERNVQTDIAKGIGIILVVAGHCISFAHEIIYLFHMPLFFFLSGCSYKESYNNDVASLKMLLYKRIKGLYLPFVLYGLPFVLLHNFFYKIHIYADPEVWAHNKMQYFASNTDWVKAILGVLTFSRIEQLLNTFWFFPALFGATMLFAILSYVTHGKSEGVRAMAVYACFMIACLIGVTEQKVLRIFTIVSLGMLAFYGGVLWRRYARKVTYSAVWGVTTILVLVSSLPYGHINVAGFVFGSPGFYLLASGAGIYIVLFLSDALTNMSAQGSLRGGHSLWLWIFKGC